MTNPLFGSMGDGPQMLVKLRDAYAQATEVQLATVEYFQGIKRISKAETVRQERIADMMVKRCQEFNVSTAQYPRLQKILGKQVIVESEIAARAKELFYLTESVIESIKFIREKTGWGLGDAKAFFAQKVRGV